MRPEAIIYEIRQMLHTDAPSDTQKFGDRLSRVETLVETMIGEFRSDRAALREDIATLQASMTAGRGVNWGAISVLVTVISLASALVGWLIIDTRGQIMEHVHQPGHIQTMIQIESIEGRANVNAAAIARNTSLIESTEERVRAIEMDRFTGNAGSELLQRVAVLESINKERKP